MQAELRRIYNSLLDCHIANLYSFYFKLYKYEQFFQKKENCDISFAVDDTIDIVNDAIQRGEKIYKHIGKMPDLSITFLTERATVNQQFDPFAVHDEVIEALLEDQTSIEKTMALTIHYSDTLALSEDVNDLSKSKEIIHSAFESLKMLIQ
jgi:hypothetical protein